MIFMMRLSNDLKFDGSRRRADREKGTRFKRDGSARVASQEFSLVATFVISVWESVLTRQRSFSLRIYSPRLLRCGAETLESSPPTRRAPFCIIDASLIK
jgi:hypothetical protein